MRAHYKFAYHAGETGYVTAEWAEKLVAGGYVIPVPEPIGVSPDGGGASGADGDGGEVVNPLPADLPGRDKLFEAGYLSVDKVKILTEDMLMDAGISKTMAKKIKKFFA